jgi:hypothetical protein
MNARPRAGLRLPCSSFAPDKRRQNASYGLSQRSAWIEVRAGTNGGHGHGSAWRWAGRGAKPMLRTLLLRCWGRLLMHGVALGLRVRADMACLAAGMLSKCPAGNGGRARQLFGAGGWMR